MCSLDKNEFSQYPDDSLNIRRGADIRGKEIYNMFRSFYVIAIVIAY